jgi:hypothetical protein
MFRRFGLIRNIRSFHDLPLWAKVLVAPAAGIAAGRDRGVDLAGRDQTEGDWLRSPTGPADRRGECALAG